MSKQYIKVTPEIKTEIIKLYQSGLGQKAIAEKYSLSPSSINRAVQGVIKPKAFKRKKKVQDEPVKPDRSTNQKEIKRLWQDEGLTKSRIAKQLKLSYSTVDKAILAMGIEEDRKIEKLRAIDRITGTIKVRLDHRTEVYFPRCDNLEERILKKKIQLRIIKD